MSGEKAVSSDSQDDDEVEAASNRDDVEVVPYVTMMEAVSTNVIPTVRLPSGKVYLAPSPFSNVDADGFDTMGAAPYSDTEVLVLGNFIDQYSVGGYLPREIALKWTKTWC